MRASVALTEEKDIEFANILLDAWQILQNECEEISYDYLSGDPARLAKNQKLIGILSTIILYDLARACYSNLEEYRYPAEDVNEDKVGLCKLNVLAPRPYRKENTPVGALDPRYKWQGNTTIKQLEFEDNSWDRGSAITHMRDAKLATWGDRSTKQLSLP
jgi:hypothetical protein